MTTTDHSGEQLTRRQMRELRLTGQTPVVADETVDEHSAPADPVPPRRDAPVNNPLPRAAEPIVVPEPAPVEADDAGAHRLTRRELRDLERVRTASVPVIRPQTQDEDSAGAEVVTEAEAVAPAVEVVHAAAEEPVAVVEAPQTTVDESPASDEAPAEPVAAAASVEPEAEAPVAGPADADVLAEPAVANDAPEQVDAPATTNATATPPVALDAPTEALVRPAWAPPAQVATPVFDAPAKDKSESKDDNSSGTDERPTLSSSFGAQVAPGASAGEQSFDELISRDSGGSTAAGHSLVLPDATLPPLTAPVTSTGAMLVTGTFNLPELGSQGHAPGVADGKDVDAVLIDGELPAASSPTPIAATAAVSQAKTPGEIIKPPVPEKSNKLMLVLAITAGVLALALVGVIVGAALTGMMQ